MIALALLLVVLGCSDTSTFDPECLRHAQIEASRRPEGAFVQHELRERCRR